MKRVKPSCPSAPAHAGEHPIARRASHKTLGVCGREFIKVDIAPDELQSSAGGGRRSMNEGARVELRASHPGGTRAGR